MSQTEVSAHESSCRESDASACLLPDIQVPTDAPLQIKAKVEAALLPIYQGTTPANTAPQLWMKLAAVGFLDKHYPGMIDAYIPDDRRESVLQAMADPCIIPTLLRIIENEARAYALCKRTFIGYDHGRHTMTLNSLFDILQRLGVDTQEYRRELAEKSALYLLSGLRFNQKKDRWEEMRAILAQLFQSVSK